MKHVTREQVRDLDRLASEQYHIPSLILMENAGAGAAAWIARKSKGGSLAIFCGKGNNGGDGFVIARHLHNRGIPLQLFFLGHLADVNPASDPCINLEILCRMGLVPREICHTDALRACYSEISQTEMVVDAIFGTGLQGKIREPIFGIMAEIASWHKPTIAIDIPSGLDANSGEVLGVALPATATITFCLPKKGFLVGAGPSLTGEVVVVDISIPRELLTNFS
jgi:NAD(P)H-hydrate epimerase